MGWGGGVNSTDCPFKAAACCGRGEGKRKKKEKEEDNHLCLLFLGAPAGHEDEDVPDQTWAVQRRDGTNPS